MTGSNYVYTNISPRHPGKRKCLLLSLVLGAVLLCTAGVVVYFMIGKDSTPHTIVYSSHDSRGYRALELPSQLRVTLVSDPASYIAACAVNVAAGSFADVGFPYGTAHFLEHLLFMGTTKYPGQNYADEVMSGAGGFVSAYTDSEVTNYWFIVSDHLKEALDVLAQFFIGPLITEDSIVRELSAVESEYKKGLASDLWSSHQLIRSTSSNASAFNG